MAEPFIIDAGLNIGIPGKAASVTVGETVTGAPGTNASVENTGSENAAVLKFTIPRGNEGQAATVAVGEVVTGAPGTNASVENTGTNNAAVFKFTIPRGNTGPSGDGSGDMVAATYDPAGGARQVAFASELAGKMDKLTGSVGQTIGFDADGNPVVQDGGGLPIVQLTLNDNGELTTEDGTLPGVADMAEIPEGYTMIGIPDSDILEPPFVLTFSNSDEMFAPGGKSGNGTSPATGVIETGVPLLITRFSSNWICYNLAPEDMLTARKYTATLTVSGWTASGGFNVQTVSVSGLKASYTVPPDIDCELTGSDASGDAAVLAAWACVSFCSTGANTLTAKCIGDAPTVNIPVIVRVFE